MKRILAFILFVALLVAAAVWLADRPGEVTIHWQGWRVDTTVPVLAGVVLALVAVLDFVLRVVRLLVEGPRRLLARRRAKRTRLGYQALSDGLAAVASGDTRRAGKLARRADKLLQDRTLTGLLTAQAAELSGDQREARGRFEDMVNRPETAYLGLKGLLDLSLKAGDRAAALDYARRAWALNPGAEGLADTLFDLQARTGQWAEAELTLAQARKSGAITGWRQLHLQALSLLERAHAAEAAGDAAEGSKLALKAHQTDPGMVPAAATAARLLHRQGKERKAAAVIETTFTVAPHPDLVAAWIALAPAETPLQRVKRMERLVKANRDAAEGHLALAEAALAARLWGQARTHLEAAQSSGRAYALLARVEREERQDEAAAQSWEAKAASTAPQPVWQCQSCGTIAAQWSACCPECGTVDGLAWKVPNGAGTAVARSEVAHR